MACCLIIVLFIRDEMSYDRHHSKADRIYRVTRNFISPDGSVNLHLGHVSPPFGPLLKNDFPDFEKVVRTLQQRVLVSYDENGEEKKAFNETNLFFSEPEIFEVFDIPVVAGSGGKALTNPFQLLMSEKTATRYFGEEQAIGKAIKVEFQTPEGKELGSMNMEVKALEPSKKVHWYFTAGPEEWIGTDVIFDLHEEGDYTIVLFGHRNWREEVEFTSHCSMKWAIFLLSLKELVENGKGRPSPDDIKIDNWN